MIGEIQRKELELYLDDLGVALGCKSLPMSKDVTSSATDGTRPSTAIYATMLVNFYSWRPVDALKYIHELIQKDEAMWINILEYIVKSGTSAVVSMTTPVEQGESHKLIIYSSFWLSIVVRYLMSCILVVPCHATRFI